MPTTVIIGAGHAGLAMSRSLTARSLDHVVLEQGAVANAWRTERWDSLRLLTPNWLLRLPGHSYDGEDLDGYLSVGELVSHLDRYTAIVDAPVRTGTTVHSVRAAEDGFCVDSDRGRLRARTVVVATGACGRPSVPGFATEVPSTVATVTPNKYRRPDQLPDGGVLVVGASATGCQLADELHRSGRPVTLAVGEHVRMPRTYRGRDIFWWLEAAGILGERHDEVDDLVRARRVPSPQLAGSPGPSPDLGSLAARGVRLVGRLGGVVAGTAQFSGALTNACALADLKVQRLLRRLDEWAAAAGLDDDLPGPTRPAPTPVPSDPVLSLDLRSGEIRSVVWATGHRPDHSWLDVPVFDHAGRIRHDGGIVVDAPGLYVLGLPILRRRASTYIHGAEHDTRDLAAHLHRALDAQTRVG